MEHFAESIEILRAAPVRVLSAGLHERRQLFSELNYVCSAMRTLDEANKGK